MKIKEIHIRECRISIDRKELDRLVSEYAMAKAGFYRDATKVEIKFCDATEGSPPYKVGTECLVVMTEDQMLVPKAEELK